MAAAFRLTNADTGATVDLNATVTTDGSGRTVVTLTFDPAAVSAGNYRLSILANSVAGQDGTPFDGLGTGAGNGTDYLGPVWFIGG